MSDADRKEAGETERVLCTIQFRCHILNSLIKLIFINSFPSRRRKGRGGRRGGREEPHVRHPQRVRPAEASGRGIQGELMEFIFSHMADHVSTP